MDAESLWAEIVSDGRYRIDNIPFDVYAVSLGDTVGGDLVDDRIACPEVLARGGHSTYRVLVEDDAGFESKSFTEFWRELERLGGSYEVAKRRWIAIDVPPDERLCGLPHSRGWRERRHVVLRGGLLWARPVSEVVDAASDDGRRAPQMKSGSSSSPAMRPRPRRWRSKPRRVW